MRAVKSVSIDSERRVIITFLDGSTETLYPNLIWCDAEALKEIIKELLEEKADAVVVTINDVAIATFADGADEALIRKLLVSIEPIQEGTGDPSPENVRPISGRTGLSVVRSGKNLLLPKKYQYTTTMVRLGGETASEAYIILKAGTYTLTIESAVSVITYYTIRNGETKTIGNNGGSFTLTDDTELIIYCYKAGGLSADSVLRWQLESGSIATDYEPYERNTYSVNWESEAGIVYGGTLDVVSGKLVINREMVDLGAIPWTKNPTYSGLFNGSLANSATRISAPRHICSIFVATDSTSVITTNNSIAISASGTTIFAHDNSYETAADFKTAMSGVQLVYQLATPTEIQLTPQEITTLLGANNIWADSGDILELEYVADTKLYIGESQSATLGSGRQTITNPEIQPVSEKTWEELSEAYKAETEEKETQEETEVERGE